MSLDPFQKAIGYRTHPFYLVADVLEDGFLSVTGRGELNSSIRGTQISNVHVNGLEIITDHLFSTTWLTGTLTFDIYADDILIASKTIATTDMSAINGGFAPDGAILNEEKVSFGASDIQYHIESPATLSVKMTRTGVDALVEGSIIAVVTTLLDIF